MAGHTKWRDINHKATPEQLAVAQRDLDRVLTLGELRRARNLTQQQLARQLDSSQPAVSAIEKRADLYLSTLRSYVEAMGGRLELVALFDDSTIQITTLAELEDHDDEPVAV